MVDHPISELEVMEPQGLNKNLCEQVFVVASTKRALFETNDEEVGDVGPSSKKPKISEEPEKVSSMSIPIDVAPLSSVRVETTPLSTKTKALMTWMICTMTFLGRLLLLTMKLQVVKVLGVQALVEVYCCSFVSFLLLLALFKGMFVSVPRKVLSCMNFVFLMNRSRPGWMFGFLMLMMFCAFFLLVDVLLETCMASSLGSYI
ncbi:hypothetical protein HanRHA438_Chr10g0443441 [Helianthus annuus]|nr:hypothetical protein HanRHA438_Chr10g0443441 [Helianthus annuus]